jgi:aspergillopepsin I
LYIPNAAAVDYYSQVPGAQYDSADGIYVLPCNSNPPDFKVKIGSGTFTVPGSYMVYAPLTAGSKTCAGGIQANTGIGFNIFGDIFLKAVYAIFDESQGSPRLGFAAQS